MYAITVTKQFTAAHALRLHDGSVEPLHEHNWQVQATVTADDLDEIECVMDFHELEEMVDKLIQPLHNGNLNETEPFASRVNPTAERVAWWLGTELAKALPPHVRLQRIQITEAPGCTAIFMLSGGE